MKHKNSIWNYLKEYKKETILAPAFKMLEALFELFVPLVVASIIDQGIRRHDSKHILWMCLLMLLLAGIGLACSVTAQYFSAKAAVGASARMRQTLFDHIMDLDYSSMDRVGPSTLLTRITSDINQVQNGINLTLRLLLRSPFIVFGAMVMAFTIDRRLSLIFGGAILLLFLVVFGVMFLTRPVYRKVQSGLDRLLSLTRENLAGVRVIRAFNLQEEEVGHFREDNDKLTALQNLAGRISGLTNPVTFVIINYAIIILIWSGALKVQASLLSVGQVVALYNYMSQILVELIKLANLIVSITKAMACYGRIQDVFDIESSITEGNTEENTEGKTDSKKTDSRRIVEFSHVSFVYEGGEGEAISDISFTADQGETIGIIGGTGSGKSTLANLICRFYDAKSGKIEIQGIDVKEYKSEVLRKMISVVPQKAQLFQGTIRSNLTLGNPKASEDDIWTALKISQAAEFVEKLPQGIDAPVAQGGRNYSGGQRQRLTIARAMVQKAPILIMDDSASALDYATDAALRQAIRSIENRPAVFIVSQRTASIMNADKILVLHDGRLMGQGRHEDLLESCQVYREIYESQFKGQEGGSYENN